MGPKLTIRDKVYLRALYTLKGSTRYIGPKELSDLMNVSKVCAFQKMRRLEYLGLGEYHIGNGLKLTTRGIRTVEEDIKQHHLLENFFKQTLNMSSEEACNHSTHMGPFICDEIYEQISRKMEADIECDCGHCLHECIDHQGSEDCHWLRSGGIG